MESTLTWVLRESNVNYMRKSAAKLPEGMPTFQVAHVRHNGQDLIIVPVDRSFGMRTPAEQARIQEAFARSAAASKIPGVVIPVWEDEEGRMAFRAAPAWRPFLQTIDMVYVATALNQTLSLE